MEWRDWRVFVSSHQPGFRSSVDCGDVVRNLECSILDLLPISDLVRVVSQDQGFFSRQKAEFKCGRKRKRNESKKWNSKPNQQQVESSDE